MNETVTQPTYKLQRYLLSFLRQLNGIVTATDLQKLVFLHTMAGDSSYYEFVPYKFGSYSFQLKEDLDILQRDGFITLEHVQGSIKIRATDKSPDSDEQATSYETQIEHYTTYINNHPDWEFAGIFADDGISGTNTKKREEFNRMIDECMAGNIDMIITKSISRFARNTLDCLKYIRQLKDKNIPVYFEKENINTMDSKGEVMLTIMASLAQQESQSLSQNVKLGLQYRYQQGEIQINCARFLGYTKDENKKLVIVPEEAEVVKRIYREYLEGASMLKIARGLEADGIRNGAGNKRWHTSNINHILRNEKYIGDALLQKTYTVDFLTKKRVKNNGIVPQYYVEKCAYF